MLKSATNPNFIQRLEYSYPFKKSWGKITFIGEILTYNR